QRVVKHRGERTQRQQYPVEHRTAGQDHRDHDDRGTQHADGRGLTAGRAHIASFRRFANAHRTPKTSKIAVIHSPYAAALPTSARTVSSLNTLTAITSVPPAPCVSR